MHRPPNNTTGAEPADGGDTSRRAADPDHPEFRRHILDAVGLAVLALRASHAGDRDTAVARTRETVDSLAEALRHADPGEPAPAGNPDAGEPPEPPTRDHGGS